MYQINTDTKNYTGYEYLSDANLFYGIMHISILTIIIKHIHLLYCVYKYTLHPIEGMKTQTMCVCCSHRLSQSVLTGCLIGKSHPSSSVTRNENVDRRRLIRFHQTSMTAIGTITWRLEAIRTTGSYIPLVAPNTTFHAHVQ